MDIDFLLERNGHILVNEFKPPGVKPGVGQARTFRSLKAAGVDLWLVQGDGPVTVDFGDGHEYRISVSDLADEVALWWEEAAE